MILAKYHNNSGVTDYTIAYYKTHPFWIPRAHKPLVDRGTSAAEESPPLSPSLINISWKKLMTPERDVPLEHHSPQVQVYAILNTAIG